ncbi:MAG: glycosyltransferase family 9 protein [Planctomycetes bacterium]|nr:glycosyltransferase family 9 protein [Planctomycetota bacterium]
MGMRIPAEPRTAAVVRLSAFGDVLHALPAIEALRLLWPHAALVFITESVGALLLDGHPALAGVIEIPRKRWARDGKSPRRWASLIAEMRSKRREIRALGAEVAIDLQGNLRSGVVIAATESPVRIGFSPRDGREGNALFLTDTIRPLPSPLHRPERDLAIARALGWKGARPRARIPIREIHRVWAETEIGAAGAARRGSPLAILIPGVSAFGRFKAWTDEGYAEVARRLRDERGFAPALICGPEDEACVARIVRLAGDLPVLRPPDPLRLAAVLSRAAVVVGADTGPVHLAAYLERPVAALFGPKDPRVYGPAGMGVRIVRSGVACSPCTRRDCDDRACMRAIDPASVLDAIGDAIAQEAAR